MAAALSWFWLGAVWQRGRAGERGEAAFGGSPGLWYCCALSSIFRKAFAMTQPIPATPDTTPLPLQATYNTRRGACSKCSCGAFKDEYDSSVCGNCGHSNSDHAAY